MSIDQQIKKTTIASRVSEIAPVPGVRLFTVPTKVKDAVLISGSFPAGFMHAPKANQLISTLTADMLDEGTRKRNRRMFREAFESVGASIGFSADTFRTRFSARCLKQHVPLVLSLIAEALNEPKFGATELVYSKARAVAEIEQLKENTRSRAEIRFRQLLFSRVHPNYAFSEHESIRLVRSIERSDLVAFHKAAYGAELTVVAGGDCDESRMAQEIKNAFGSRRGGMLAATSFGSAREPQTTEETITVPDKANVDIFIAGLTGLRERDSDYIPLSFGMYVLGGTFFGRLYQRVREEQGLTYGVRGTLGGSNDDTDGYWSVWGTFAPELLDAGKASLRAEIERFVTGGITEGELETFKETVRGAYTVGFGTAAGFAAAVLGNAEQGRPTSWLDEYLSRVQNLTLDEVNEVIKRHIDPTRTVTVAAGAV